MEAVVGDRSRDAVRYVGGYTPRKHASDVRDLAVIAAVQRGEPVEPLPTLGRAIGRALNSRLDPLGSAATDEKLRVSHR